jgi:autotransporter-associated beta strand protein
VKRSTINGGETTTTGTTTTNSYVDTNLVNGTTYYYVVSALNAGGESPNSVQVIARPSTLATITFTANDNVGSSSFSTGLHWSDGLAPSSNKEYVQGLTNAALRTPNGGGSITFAGHSLTLNNGGILAFKAANGSTITIGTDPATSLIMDIGFVSVFDGGRTESLGGFVTLNTGGGQFSPNTGTLPITAQIGGTGFLKVVENAALAQNGRVILSASNTYAGGTILDTADTLQLSGSGTLGATNGPFTLSDSLNRGQGTLDLNGTSQRIGNLTGTSLTGRIINSSATTASTLTIGNGDTGGGTFLGSIGDGSGVMALVKVGSGAITFAGTNSYSGDTLVEKGTLLINGLSSLSPITVSNGATLGGTGIIGGTVNIASGGNLAPGNAGVGVLTFTNNLTLLGNILMKINRSVAPSNDLCVINGLLTSGGVSTLTVTNLGPPLQTGDTFKLFSVPVGGFATVTLPALNTGSIWQNRLAVDGTIKVVARAFTNATALAVQWTSTNTLVLSWPSDHTGWRLQAQTNSLNVGIGVNWVEVAGASLTNQISIPLSTANDSVFFRLVYP